MRLSPEEWDALPWWEQELYWRHLAAELGVDEPAQESTGDDEETYKPGEQPDIGEFAGFGVRMVS